MTALRIIDNGIGLAKAARLDTGMGMSIMRYRAKLAGAELIVAQGAEGGTTVACLIPATAQELNARPA
jgi:signal transduction histidine kinase